MGFSSITFLFFFLPLFLGFYFATPGIRAKNAVTVAFSLLFYAWGEPKFVPLLLASIGFNMLAALVIDAQQGVRRKCALAFGIAVNLGLLAGFKYGDFLSGNFNSVLAPFGFHLPAPHLPLPLGISFFTFHCLSYLVDVGRRRFAANRDPLEMALYIALFPQLVAGPIVRYKTIARQLRARRHSVALASAGARIFVIGLAQKLLLADQIAPLAEAVFDHTIHPGLVEAWLGLFAYTLQIYFDFAGYSAMAIGLGLCLGFSLPRNFRLPYTARSITEFWRRWHMSLSAWFRDYLYVPLGGNRGGKARTYRNLIVVFLLCGLWHGASWNFVLWGVWHGGFLVLERAGLKRHLDSSPTLLGWSYAMLAVMGGWVLFRTSDLAQAGDFAAGLLGWHGTGTIGFHIHELMTTPTALALVLGGFLAVFPGLPAIRRLRGRLRRPYALIVVVDGIWSFGLLALCMTTVAAGTYSPFLYFRF